MGRVACSIPRKGRVLKPRAAGFSIIELSIIIAIAAFVIANAYILSSAKKELQKFSDTYDKMENIKLALTKHVNRYGYYPCPAGGLVPHNDETLGAPICDFEGEEDTVNGLFKISTYGFDFQTVLLGVLPTKALGLPSNYMMDQWGNRITYAVVKNLTTRESYVATTDGVIQINSAQGPLTRRVAYVAISHGENGVGSWPFNGTVRKKSPAEGIYEGGEQENHHMDAADPWDEVFYYATRPPLDTTGHKMIFDDILIWSQQEDPQMPDEIVNFSPHDIRGLVVWLDGTEEATIQRDGNNRVTRWQDKTSVHNNAAANDALGTDTAHMPLYVPAGQNAFSSQISDFTLNAVRFVNGESNALTIDVPPGDTSLSGTNLVNLTLFIVATSNTDGTPDRKMFIGRGVSTADDSTMVNGWGFGSTVDNFTRGFWLQDHADELKRVDATFQPNDFNAPKIWAAKYDSAYWLFGLMKFYQACADLGSQVYDTASLMPTGNLPIRIGAQYLDVGNAAVHTLEGDIGEVIIYSTPLSDWDRERITRYLATKWGIAPDLATCSLAAPQCLPGTMPKGGACTSNSGCCSGACSGSGTCCVPINYSGGFESCVVDGDCCPGSICSLGGICWRP